MIVFGIEDHLQLLTQKKDKGNDFLYVINSFFNYSFLSIMRHFISYNSVAAMSE